VGGPHGRGGLAMIFCLNKGGPINSRAPAPILTTFVPNLLLAGDPPGTGLPRQNGPHRVGTLQFSRGLQFPALSRVRVGPDMRYEGRAGRFRQNKRERGPLGVPEHGRTQKKKHLPNKKTLKSQGGPRTIIGNTPGTHGAFRECKFLTRPGRPGSRPGPGIFFSRSLKIRIIQPWKCRG